MSAISASSASIATLRISNVRSWMVIDAGPQLLLRPLVAGLAGAVDVEQRALHVMVADLHRAGALVRHVAVGAGHARPRVDALVPHLELGVLGLEHRRAGLGVRPVLEAVLLVVGEDLVGLQALVPRIGETLLGALEVVLDVALAADVGAHLLARRHRVDVVVRSLPSTAFTFRMPSRKPGRVTRSCIVCGSWQSMHATGCSTSLRASPIGHLVHRLEALDQIAAAELLVGHVDRPWQCMQVPGCFVDLLPLGVTSGRRACRRGRAPRGSPSRRHSPPTCVFRRGSSSRRDCATIDRGSACVGVRGTASLPPYACAPGRRCAGSRRTAAGSSCPTPPGRRSRRSARRRGRTGSAPPACARRC